MSVRAAPRVREATLLNAITVMEGALRVYRDGKWNHDYPGGIDLWPIDDALEMGGAAARALRHPSVKRAVATARSRVGG